MAERTRRHGVSGNPARRAQAEGPSAPGRARSSRQSYVLGAALVAAALLVLLVPRPGDDPGPSGPAQGVAPTSDATTPAPEQVQTTGEPQKATDEAFCEQFVTMVNVQGEFLGNGETRPDLVERAAQDLVAVGVPASMSLPARAGYYNVVSGVYDSIGQRLAPEAVGAAPAAVEGADMAFTAYLDAHCPA